MRKGTGVERQRGSFGCLLLLTFLLGTGVIFFRGYSPPLSSGATLPSSRTTSKYVPQSPASYSGEDRSAEQREQDSWMLLLVNINHPIPKEHTVKLKEIDNGEFVDERIYPELRAMLDAMQEQGIYTVVESAYRTTQTQQRIMDDKVAELRRNGYRKDEAKEIAKTWVAVPGTSEHQLGLAVDINADKIWSNNQQVYNWLASNSYHYGFILRYPPDKTEITLTSYEPWHYRYVGAEAARDIFEQGVCLEEYLDNLY